jgi:hypothetical protein
MAASTEIIVYTNNFVKTTLNSASMRIEFPVGPEESGG